MNNTIKISDDELKRFKFKDSKIVKYQQIGSYNICFFLYEKSSDLAQEWERLNSFMCNEITKNISSDFEAWNIYLVFISQDQVERKFKYEIENDKHFSRKIVLDRYEYSDLSNYLKILESKILLNNISSLKNTQRHNILPREKSLLNTYIESTLGQSKTDELYAKVSGFIKSGSK